MISRRPSIPRDLVDAIVHRRLTPFVGAGLSKQASPKLFPTWNQLLSRFITFSVESDFIAPKEAKALHILLDRGQSLIVAESLKTSLPKDQYLAFIQSQFPTDIIASEAHHLVYKLHPSCIITTNYDRLLESAYYIAHSKLLPTATYSQPGQVRNRLKKLDTFLFKIHGDIESPSDLILAQSDYQRLEQTEQGYKMVLSSVFVYTTVLFLGFSLRDAELLHHLERVRDALHHEAMPHFAIVPDSALAPGEGAAFHRRYGVRIMSYRPTNNHEGMLALLKALVSASQP
jgi:hypothetical protein